MVLQSSVVSPRSPRYRCDVISKNKQITYEEAVHLQNGFCVPAYLVVYPPEAMGIYIGSWIKVQILHPSVIGEACVLSEGRVWLSQEQLEEKFFDVI